MGPGTGRAHIPRDTRPRGSISLGIWGRGLGGGAKLRGPISLLPRYYARLLILISVTVICHTVDIQISKYASSKCMLNKKIITLSINIMIIKVK